MTPTSNIAIQCLGYTPIPVALLSCDEVPRVDLYRKDAETGRLRLYRAAEVPMLPEDLTRLEQSKVGWLYTPEADHGEMQVYIRRKLDQLVGDNSISVRERFGRLNEVVSGILESTFEAGETDEVMQSSAYVASQAIKLLCQNEMTAGDLISLLHHDYQTVTHSLNVAYMMVTLAREMRLVSDSELFAVAVAGILHDIGKLSVSERILNKSQRLQRREERVAQKHPAHGFRRLCERTDISFAQLMVVYQHHERMTGKGYPVGAVGEEIHPWARLCSVVNVFESLVSNRPYRRRYPLTEAFQIMDGPLSAGLDREMYECWKQLILKK
ncbi:HD domain-containing protein [Bremerella cremea]|uniref:HD domain-containing protein n=1 Tax=Bremerella cremea TaxID=1031537 RepID=A0A368KSJ7_9BACT|nr:HD domain-containing phosphohydrolase [Bremerella cremea]RCS46276.1 HD domain-containing protein [Bremerella cremea]